MATFQLKQEANTFDFDTTGNVTSGGSPVGTWDTNAQNQIVLTNSSGNTSNFDVTWAFNGSNQLVVGQNGTDLLNFDTTAENRSFYAARNAALQVFPDISSTFVFLLHGDWTLSNDHKLQLTINNTTSTIDGFIQDPRGRFMYHFMNKDDQTQESILGFVGQWTSAANASGDPTLTFTYKKEDGSTGTFTLPQSIAINRTINQLMYEYDKDGQTFRLQFEGTLSITPEFQISYAIDRQVSKQGGEQVASTTITMDAVFTRNDFTGDLALQLKRQDGTTSNTTLTIAGNFTAVLGPDQLRVGFAFSQVRAGNTITTSFGFNGTLTLSNIGQVQWQFQMNAQSINVSLGGQVQLKDGIRIDGRFNLQSENGTVKSITGMFGISF